MQFLVHPMELGNTLSNAFFQTNFKNYKYNFMSIDY